MATQLERPTRLRVQPTASDDWSERSSGPHQDPLSLRDNLAVAASPRYRASQRRRVGDASRHGMVLVVAAALLDCLWLAPMHRDVVGFVVGANAAIVAVAALAYAAIATRARRRPEPYVFVALLAVDGGSIALGAYQPELGVVAAGYLLLLPVVVALVIPWATRIHLAWLTIHTLVVLGFAVLAPLGPLGIGGRRDLLALLMVATAVSVFGHIAALRSRVLSFVHIESIRALNRQARRDQARLDRLNTILEQTARTDELTGLRNRMSLRLDLAAVRSRIARHHERFGILMLDLDRFKAVNDARGHVAGDAVLRDVARALVTVLRPDDGTYRYGGEEFVVLLRVRQPSEALAAGERLRRAVEALHLRHPGNPPHDRMTISVGVAVIGPEDLGADDDAWLARSDAALYRAKAGGRNRCESEAQSVDAA